MRIYLGIMLLIAVAALAYWQWTGIGGFAEDVDVSVIEDEEKAADQADFESEDSGDNVSRSQLSSRPEALAAPDEGTAWSPFESTTDARELILNSASTFGWSEAAALQTARNWSRACEPARRLESYKDYSLDDSVQVGRFPLKLLSFVEFCETLPEASDLSSGEAREEVVRAATGSRIDYLGRREAQELIGDDPSLARETLVSQLHQALLNFDEAMVTSSILFLLRPEIEAIQTRLEGRYDLWHMEYARVLDSISITLLCQYHGGCIGKDHPMVLRICMLAWESSGVGCLEPRDVFEAVYQTQTPVEHMMYQNVLDQINHMLISYRRS